MWREKVRENDEKRKRDGHAHFSSPLLVVLSSLDLATTPFSLFRELGSQIRFFHGIESHH